MLNRETANTNFIVFGLTRSGLERMIYHTQGELKTNMNGPNGYFELSK